MKYGKGEGVSKAVADLGKRILKWRKTRKKRTAMPEELWQEAAILGRKFGIYPVARELRLHYGRLKQLAYDPYCSRSKDQSISPEFVEIRGFQPAVSKSFDSSTSGTMVTEVELNRPDGTTLRVRQDGGVLDIAGMVAAYCGSQR